MTRDEILAQYGGQAPAPAEPAAPAPDTSAPALTQMLQGGLSQPMTRDEILAAYATDPREAYAGGFGRALGLVGGDNPRYQRENTDYPGPSAVGMGSGIGLSLATGGPGLVRGGAAAARSLATAAPRIAETGLRAGGAATRWGGGLAALLHGNLPGAYVVWKGGKKMSAMGQALRADRMARAAPKLAEEIAAAAEAPLPAGGALSAEMRAALKRGKFRHDYSTGEWRDLLAPGE